MTRNDAVELAGIGLFLLGSMTLFYGVWQLLPLATWFIATAYLIVGGLACIGVANRPNRGSE